MNFFAFILQDFTENRSNSKGRIVCLLFRIGNYCSNNPLFKILFLPYLIFYKIIVEWFLGIEIPYNTTVGNCLRIFHGQGLVINSSSVIGSNVTLRHNTTIGNSIPGGPCPVIEDNVNIGANCVLIGPIRVGQNSIIGAGSVVVKSIPPDSVAVGNPAKVVKFVSSFSSHSI